MITVKPGLPELLERTDIIQFDDFLVSVKEKYQFTVIKDYDPILEGYENANMKLFTDKGLFVMKIFSKDVARLGAEEYIKVTEESIKKGIPFPPLLQGKDCYLQEYQDESKVIFYFLMRFFEGENFEQQEVKIMDIEKVTSYLAQFNTLTLPVEEIYDSWGNKNLIEEYAKNKGKISKDIDKFLVPVVDELSGIDFSKFSNSLIHGDMQRKHVLKNKQGEYCILDLGCMRNDAKVYDLSVHFAWFCLAEDTWDKKEEIVSLVLDAYTKLNKLTPAELRSIPLLTKAAYAAYLLRTSLLIQAGDRSDETHEWHNRSKKMLELMNSWDWKI